MNGFRVLGVRETGGVGDRMMALDGGGWKEDGVECGRIEPGRGNCPPGSLFGSDTN